MPVFDWSPLGVYGIFMAFWIFIATPILVYRHVIRRTPRPKPEGYVGRFRRPDGLEVHVARVNGRLMVIQDTEDGELPLNLGNVSGRDLLKWHKVSSTPDGQDCITRSK